MLKYFLPIMMAFSSLQAYMTEEILMIVDDKKIYLEIEGHIFLIPLMVHMGDCPKCVYNRLKNP